MDFVFFMGLFGDVIVKFKLRRSIEDDELMRFGLWLVFVELLVVGFYIVNLIIIVDWINIYFFSEIVV